jgi:LysM repeat protein
MFDVSWILSEASVRHWHRRSIEPPFDRDPEEHAMSATMTATMTHQPTATNHREARRSSGAVRLTRRGRVVLLLAMITLALVAFILGRVGSSSAATDAPRPTAYASATVHSGETLWSVAKRVAPGHDPRDVIAQIQQLNHLQGGAVRAGQQLLLPHVA